MFYWDSGGEAIGILNDYDLSSMKNVASGRERTGTVPFMAISLLTPQAIEGERLYQHAAGSFILVLTWVCFQYQDGAPLRNDRPLDEWRYWMPRGKKSLLSFWRHENQPRHCTGPAGQLHNPASRLPPSIRAA